MTWQANRARSSRMRIRSSLLAALLLTPASAWAQGLATPSVGVEATSDDRRRGLSWSDGRATIVADAAVPIGDFRIDVAAAGLRESRRHGGADLGIDAGARWTTEAGGWRLRAGGTGHIFVDRSALNYVEVQAGAAYTLGPASLDLAASYAPSQDAIGGDTLYLSAGLNAGIPATPVTIYAGIGRTIGDGSGERARRLRPDGDYWDYRLGAEYVLGPASAGARLTATSIDPDRVPVGRYTDRHLGAVLAGYVRLGI